MPRFDLQKKKYPTKSDESQSSESSLEVDYQMSSVEISKAKMDVPKHKAPKKINHPTNLQAPVPP